MASRMSMLLKDLDLTLNEFESDLAGGQRSVYVPPVPALPATSTLMNSLAKEEQAEDTADAYDFLDDYGDETDAVSDKPAAAPAAVEIAPVAPLVVPAPIIPKVTPTLTQFEPPVSMQHLMRQQNHQQPATQPVPREYAAYQAPPSKFPTHVHVPHPNQQQQQQQQQPQQYMHAQQQQHMQMPMPANDDFRRISTATSVNSSGFDDTLSMTSKSAADDEVAALREQLERAKQDLQDQMYMNKVLVSQHQSKPSHQQQPPLTPISLSSPVTPGPSNESIKDKSDTQSVSSQKSGKSTSSGWFMSRSKSQSKDSKKPASVHSATPTTPTTPVEMKKKKSTHKLMLQGAGTFDMDMF
ncbi:hypothetical protein HDU77_009693 [Chytriomyces hyalinus]|nr:hypothetical protein HDU77_009693 [Chytriomyces hyalinus]